MDILRFIKRATPEQCQELGDLIIEMGTKERSEQWHQDIDAAIEIEDARGNVDL